MIKILGSAHVISIPNRKAKIITTISFFCFDKEAPIYSPTLIKLVEAPIWKKDNPKIIMIPPIVSIT